MKQLINKIKKAIKLSGKKKWDEKNKQLSKEINELLEGHEEEFDEENEQLLKEINELFEGCEEGFKKVEEKYDQLLKEMDETINKYC